MSRIMPVRPPETMHMQLREAAKEIGIPLNSLICMILAEWLKAQQNQEIKRKE